MIPMKMWSGVLAVLLALTGCAATPPTPADGRLAVVASFYPLQFVVERVGGDRVAVTTLTQPGVDPHDVELTPTQVAAISRAALVVYQKGLQAAVDRVVETEGPARVVEATEVVPLHDHPAGTEAAPVDADHAHASADPHLARSHHHGATDGRRRCAGGRRPRPRGVSTPSADSLAAELTTSTRRFIGLASCDRRTFVHSARRLRLPRRALWPDAGVVAGLARTPSVPGPRVRVQRTAKRPGDHDLLRDPHVTRCRDGIAASGASYRRSTPRGVDRESRARTLPS
jgi:hypothetical protein